MSKRYPVEQQRTVKMVPPISFRNYRQCRHRIEVQRMRIVQPPLPSLAMAGVVGVGDDTPPHWRNRWSCRQCDFRPYGPCTHYRNDETYPVTSAALSAHKEEVKWLLRLRGWP